MVRLLFVICIGLAVWLGLMIAGANGQRFSSGGLGIGQGSSISAGASALVRKFWN